MNRSIFFALIAVSLNAKVYYSKIEPYEIRSISSNVSAQVVFTDEKKLGKLLDADDYIKLDDELDLVELKQLKEKTVLLNDTVKLDEEIVKNYRNILEKKNVNYDRIKVLKIKSTVEKDKEFYDLYTTQNQYLSTKKELDSLKMQLLDTSLQIARLNKSVKDKHLNAKNFVLYDLMVKEGQVVSPGTPLAKVADVSKAILTVFLDEKDVKGIESKKIYIDGQKTNYKISRLWNITDETHISSYKAQIIVKTPHRFSKLVQIEFKDE
ncbi:HlyD family efflux transporter periplasmic adaptor subunit [Sulfurimonas sp. HSL-1716]|uniref:HlyD family efflux transporter periplasmic adaptor subunit n=1 Tax=Hydrocurvibacter sulfurireducens TaxID=3131937 RepID=UPI0031F99E87